MKVKIKKTGEICNIASWAKVALEFCDSYIYRLQSRRYKEVPDNVYVDGRAFT